MSWMTPMTALIAGAVGVPLLVLLYFLKLKRREVSISSTLLWKRAVQDLQVNAPFQRLRKNILLLLQMLALLALVTVLGGPMMAWRGGAGKQYVILIDRSASMSAREGSSTRLAQAKKLAREFVETLRQENLFGGGGDQAMVVAFADEPQVICPFVGNQRKLLSAIDSVQPTDGGTRIGEAIRIARAYGTATDPEAMGRSAVSPAKLVLFTDGRIGDTEKVVLSDGELTVYRVGEGADNVAVTALQARRSFEDPREVSVFAGLANYRLEAAACDVQLLLDGKNVAFQHVTLPAGKANAEADGVTPGRTGVTFTLQNTEGGVLQVRQTLPVPDMLAADDAAWTVLPPPRRLSAVLVGPGNLVLEEALRSLPLARFETMTPEQFDAIDPDAFEMERRFDVVVLDRVQPKKLPRCGYLVFGQTVSLEGLSCEGPNEDQFILDWRQNHPALRYINLENVYARTWWKLKLPSDAHVLAESDGGAALASLNRGGSTFLLVNFDILSSNWPFRPGFVMFLYNAVNVLGNAAEDPSESSLAVGSILNARVPSGLAEAAVYRPDGTKVLRKVDPGGFLRYAPLDRVGVYRVELSEKHVRPFAVNLTDPAESDIAPAKEVKFSGESVALKKAEAIRANMDVRPWLLLFAILILCVEWFIYNKKVQI